MSDARLAPGTMLMVDAHTPHLTIELSATDYAEYPFSCRHALRRQRSWLADYSRHGDAEAGEIARLDLEAIRAELRC